MLDVLDAALDVLALHGALLERVQKTIAQLGDVERLAPIVALDDVRHDELGAFERREPLSAREALAAAAHLPALAGQTRVRDLRVLKAAERAMHKIFGAPRFAWKEVPVLRFRFASCAYR